MDYLTFRSNALSNLTLVKPKDKPKMSKTQQEKWIKKEYERHYGTLDDFWDDPAFLEKLETDAELEKKMTHYEHGQESE